MRTFGTLKSKERRNDEKGIVNFFVKRVISVERLDKKKTAAYRLQILCLRYDISTICVSC